MHITGEVLLLAHAIASSVTALATLAVDVWSSSSASTTTVHHYMHSYTWCASSICYTPCTATGRARYTWAVFSCVSIRRAKWLVYSISYRYSHTGITWR